MCSIIGRRRHIQFGLLQRPPAARSEGNHERGGVARAERATAGWDSKQGAAWRTRTTTSHRAGLPSKRLGRDRPGSANPRLRLLFDTYRQTRSASMVVRRFRREGWSFPRRIRRGIGKGEVHWGALTHRAFCRSSTIPDMLVPLFSVERELDVSWT